MMLLGGGSDHSHDGQDQLWKGAGADRFVFNRITETTAQSGTADRIRDFSARDGDVIDLRGIDANVTQGHAGNDAFDWIGGQAFHHMAGELSYADRSGGHLLMGDVDGDGKADFVIEVDTSGLLSTLL